MACADILRHRQEETRVEGLEGFSDALQANGFPAGHQRAVGQLPFADYAFNVTCRRLRHGVLLTAYPSQLSRRVLRRSVDVSFRDDKDKAAVYLADCRKPGITCSRPTSTNLA